MIAAVTEPATTTAGQETTTAPSTTQAPGTTTQGSGTTPGSTQAPSEYALQLKQLTYKTKTSLDTRHHNCRPLETFPVSTSTSMM